MYMKKILLLLFFFIPKSIYSQEVYERDLVVISYEDSSLGRKIICDVDKHKRLIHSYLVSGVEGDSLTFEVDNKEIISEDILVNPSLGVLKHIKFKGHKGAIIRVLLHHRKSFVEFPIDSRYRIMKLYYYEQGNGLENHWLIIFSNYVSSFK